jgi:hypothetical protein
MFFLRRVEGDSMLPSLKAGDIVLARLTSSMKAGSIVIAKMNGREVIKRVRSASKDGAFLVGDNLHKSSDSRKYGMVPKSDILGTVIFSTSNMSKFKFSKVKATAPPQVKNRTLLVVPYIAATLIFFLLLSILVTFDKFVVSIDGFLIDETRAKFFASSIVLSLLFALPFLLSMRLSPLARVCSIVCTLVAPVFLLMLTLVSLNYDISADSDEFNYYKLYAHTWAYSLGLVLFSLCAWSFYILKGSQAFKSLKKQ